MFREFFTSHKWESVRMSLAMLTMLTAAVLIAFNFNAILKGLGNVVSAFMPFIIGAVIAYILNLLMVRWEKLYFPKVNTVWVRKTRRPVSLALSVIMVSAVIALITYFISTELMDAAIAIAKGFIDLLAVVNDFVDQNSYLYGLIGGNPEELSTYISKTLDTFGGPEEITASFFKFASTFVSGALDVIIAIVFSLYVLMDKENIISGWRSFGRMILPRRAYRTVSNVLSVANGCFSRFVYGQCVEAFILGTLCAIGLEVFGFEYAIPVGLIVGSMSIVPIVGAWIGGIVGAVMMFSVSLQDAVLFLVFLLILQQLESNFIYPKVVGTSVGVPGIWVLCSVFVGGALFNVAGILLAVPLVATCLTLLQQYQDQLASPDDDIDESMFVVNMREVATDDQSPASK